MKIKYSIVIPTRNGAKYLPFAVRSVLDIKREDIELIVSNNFSTDNTQSLLESFNDSRLRIVHPPVCLPMAGHYEFAINQAKGEWITIIGDDDAVMPYIFESLDNHIFNNPNIDIIFSARAYYFWQGIGGKFGNIVVQYSSNNKTFIRSTQKDLIAVLSGLRSCFDMPQIYTTGIVRRTLYNEIKDKSGGCFYHSIIPDMYSEVALCMARDSYLRVEEPLFWVGTSNKSMGISDRIYKDAERFNPEREKQIQCVPRHISPNISYKLHAGGFSPLYIYECIHQSPISKALYSKNLIRNVVIAAILNAITTRKGQEKKELKNEIFLECNKYGISPILVQLISVLLLILTLFNKVTILIKLTFGKVGLKPRDLIRFKSTDGQAYSDILLASIKIEELRNTKLRLKKS